MHSLKSIIVILYPQTCDSYIKTISFVSIVDECDVMTCLHSAHTLAVARPCDYLTQVHFIATISFCGTLE